MKKILLAILLTAIFVMSLALCVSAADVTGSAEHVTVGDVDGDGDVTNADVLAIYRYIYNSELYPLPVNLADVDGDGDVTNADVLAIYRYIYNPALYPLSKPAPIGLNFTSNGDGTCYVKEIRVDKDYSGDIHLVIPEKAPNGDTVVEIRNFCGLNGSATTKNVPVYLTFESMNAIVDKIKQANDVTKTEKHGFTVGVNRERDAKIFKAFYGEKISENGKGFYELEPFISFNEMDRLAIILNVYAYSEEDCYNDTVKFLDSLAGEKEDKSIQAREAFKYLYHVGDRITEITLPSTVKKIGYGAFDGCDNLKKVNGISDGCVLGVQKSDPDNASVAVTEIVINGTEKSELFSYEAANDANADFINALN